MDTRVFRGQCREVVETSADVRSTVVIFPSAEMGMKFESKIFTEIT